MGNRGVALLQALIFVGLIAMTAATLLSLSLGSFIGSAKTKTSGQDKFDAMSILPRVYDDLGVCDPEADGSFSSDPCPSQSEAGVSWDWNPAASEATTTPFYNFEPGVASSRDVSVRVKFCVANLNYKVAIVPCEGAGPCNPTVTCP